MTRTKPCPYCGHKLRVAKGREFVCSLGDWARFRFDGKQFRRVKA